MYTTNIHTLNLTTDKLKVLLSDAAQHTQIIIKGPDGKDHRIGSVRYETVRELVPVIANATIETGHETIGTKEQSRTQLIIQLL